MTLPLTWVVGRGGLLGAQVEARLSAGSAMHRPAAPIAWDAPAVARSSLESEISVVLDRAARTGRPWRLLWCAGAGVVATSADALAAETELFEGVLDGLARRLAREPALAATGTVFLASSAGAVYAASEGVPPFDERSPVGALAPYGREKLRQEALVGGLADACRVGALVGRLSNLYGPGQRLDKPQGLISHVGRAALRREPISIYVPLDTIRDYLFADDAGRMVAAAILCMEDARPEPRRRSLTVKVFASEVETTVAAVLGAWRQALRRPLQVALASSPIGRLQPRVLSFRSRVWPELRRSPTLLPLGIDAVRRDQLARLLSSGLG